MTTAVENLALADAVDRMKTTIKEMVPSTPPAKRRIEISIDCLDPLDWLRVQRVNDGVYWRSRNGTLEVAGVGSADTISWQPGEEHPSMLNRLEEKLRSVDERARYFGGIRFDPLASADRVDACWASFGAARFILPRVELVRTPEGCCVVCNFGDQGDFETEQREALFALDQLLSDQDQEPDRALTIMSREDEPNFDGWSQSIDAALDEFTRGSLQKIVLARRSSFAISHALDPWRLLGQLRDSSQNCFLFGIRPGVGAAFVGATPERLYRRSGDRIESEAVAGTRQRGATEAEDRDLEHQLLTSEKDAREHKFVVDSLRQQLERRCHSLEADLAPRALKAAQVQHLCTRFRGKLNSEVGDHHLLSELAPTPAVGGFPTREAREGIARLESFDRGWYAGPVGWIGRGAAEFAVAIRSGLIFNGSLNLYSGAGIVDGSNASSEWSEIDDKLRNFLNAVGGAGG